MMPMIRWITALLATSCLVLAACVTINVYFPGGRRGESRRPHHRGHLGTGERAEARGQRAVVDRPGCGRTHARGPRRCARFRDPGGARTSRHRYLEPGDPRPDRVDEGPRPELEGFFSSGAIGLTSDGLVEIRDANAVALADRNRLRKLVSDDNADRNSLYREIAGANGHPEWEADIRSTFAERWIANARAGWYYKSKAGAWTQK